MIIKKISSAILMGMILIQVGCGKSDSKNPDDVNIKDLTWVGKNDVLRPVSSIAVQGEVFGNREFVVTFKITDSSGKELSLTDQTLQVSSQKPPSGKTSLKLHDDMDVLVEAGQNVCNGDYTLHVRVRGGNADVTKPLNFKVVDGLDASRCQKPTVATEVKRGALYNVQGRDKGAFDLIEGKGVGQREDNSKKDLLDLTVMGRNFRMTLGSGNGAMFVMDNGLDFNSLTFEQANNAFQNGTKKSETSILKINDIVLVKLPQFRDQNSVYVLKITNVNQTGGSSSSTNKGVIEFIYKKLGAGLTS